MDNPKLPSRREAIARTLLVPPALLGLVTPSISSDNGVIEILSKSNLDVLQSLVSLAWGMFYSGDFQQATQSIDAWLANAHSAQKSSKGVVRDQLNATIVHMLQLSATAARDRGNATRAYKAGQQALSGSTELSNVNLILASHHHLFRVYMQEEKWKQAQTSIDASIHLAEHHSSVNPAMKGTIYVDAGEVYSILARTEPGLIKKSLNFFDMAGQVARKHKDETESEFIRFSLARVMNERAGAAAGFHRMHDAENAIHLAKKTLTVSNIRWNKDHLLSSADMHIGEEDVTGCYTDMLEAIKLHKETNSRSNLNWMLRLHQRCIIVDPGNKYREIVEEQLHTL